MYEKHPKEKPQEEKKEHREQEGEGAGDRLDVVGDRKKGIEEEWKLSATVTR